MKEITTQIDIKAPPETVWKILADLDGWQRWNGIFKAKGQVEQGARLIIDIALPGKKPMTFRPKVLRVETNKELRWRGHLLMPGIFDGEHRFVLAPLDGGGCRLEHAERFTGVLVPFIFDGKVIGLAFTTMNRAVKKEAERAAQSAAVS